MSLEQRIDEFAELVRQACARRDADFFAPANRKALSATLDLMGEACARARRAESKGQVTT